MPPVAPPAAPTGPTLPQPGVSYPQDPINPAPQPLKPHQDFSTDYLNQIAPKDTQKTVNRFAVFGMIAGFIVLAIFAVFLISGGGKPNYSTQTKTVSSRLTALHDVTKTQQPRLKETEISTMNATLTASLASMQSSLAAATSQKTPSGTTAESRKYSDKLNATLEDAHLIGTLDRTYATQMTYELTLLKGQLQRLKSAASRKSVTEYYDSNVGTLDAAIKQFSEFTASK